MLCPYCGHFSTTDTTVCGLCGKLLPRPQSNDTGVRAIRQGKRARMEAAQGVMPGREDQRKTEGRTYVDPDVDRPLNSEPLYTAPEVFDANGDPIAGDMYRRPGIAGEERRDIPTPSIPRGRHAIGRKTINWVKVAIALAVFFLGGIIGVGLFLTRTPSGQRIMARAGFDANSTAFWEVGAERMDTGDIDGAIEFYEKAAELDGEENVNVAGLLALGGAYEAAGRLQDAEALYVHIYTDVVPSASDAYTNVIRIMLSDGREAQAAVLMQEAYNMTHNSAFISQRNSLLPSPPSVNIAAGYYEQEKTLRLTSAEGYIIYYTFDENAVLPYGGEPYTVPLVLKENTWPLRAVAVNDTLVSDELSATYTISMPSPGMPYPSLAANTYTQRQRVRIFQNIERTRDPNVTIYYTIDGSEPDADSPIYDQDAAKGILLPGGRVTLKAVAVNEYGKASNTLSVGYKIEAKPYPLDSYTYEDTANGLRLNGTNLTDFTNAYGQPQSQEEIVRSNFSGKVTKYTYSWGYAVFHNLKGVSSLIELYFTGSTFKGPRGTGIGASLDQVVGKFRDMGQPESPSGNRGLYSNGDGTGRIYVNGNGTRRVGEETIIYPQHPVKAHVVRYTCRTLDSHTWSLDYIFDTSDRVAAIDMLYIP